MDPFSMPRDHAFSALPGKETCDLCWLREEYHAPAPCPECGAPDAEYGQHEPGCPSGYPTREPAITESEMRALAGDR